MGFFFFFFFGSLVVRNPPSMQEMQEMWVQCLDQEDLE